MTIPSETGNEAEIAEFLGKYLAAFGYRVDLPEVSIGRNNVLALASDVPTVVFCTHLDTVSPLLEIREDQFMLHGRGACDAKGIIAAMIEAGERLRRRGVHRFGFLFLVGEEVDGAGAKNANKRPIGTKYVIVGEPTRNHLAIAQKGTLMANLRFRGKAAHSGYPEVGVSAIEELWKVLRDCQELDWGNDPIFGKGTFNVGVFRGGEKANIVAEHAFASVMVRTVEPRSLSEAKLRATVGDRAELDVIAGANPFRMHVVDGFPTTVVSFGSDAPYLTEWGKPLLIGPGSILDAHTAHERIRKDELMEGVDAYEQLALKLILEDDPVR